MTYHNRLLSTPYYINNFRSPYWNYVAQDTAYRLNETCPHTSNMWNMRVKCFKGKDRISCEVSCLKCDHVFRGTERFLITMVGYTGF